MITEDKFNLRPIWDACLEIYKEVAKICDKHGLRYYATDGTALGAIRHNGYVPWDDDFDISMPRPDYEKFKQIAAQELPTHLKFVDFHNTPEFRLLFGKVQDTRKEVIDDIEKRLGRSLSNGSYIDIFPIDGYPTNPIHKIVIKIIDFLLSQSRAFRFIPLKRRTLKGRLMSPVGFFVAMFTPWIKSNVDYLKVYERILLKYSFDNALTGRSCSNMTVLRRAPLKQEAWGKPTPHEFHDTQIMVPEDADAHLKNEYYKWDYMQLPPEKDRHPTHEYAADVPWKYGPTRD